MRANTWSRGVTAQRLESARPWVGCVLRIEVGVLVVLTDGGEVRASLDGCLLGAIARDRAVLPIAGDWVMLRQWPDGRVTAVRPIRPSSSSLAPVVPLRA